MVRASIDTSGGEAPIVIDDKCERLSSIVHNALFVYYTCIDGGTVKRVAKAGGSPIVLAKGQDRPDKIALDDGYVYWANQGTAAGVFRVAN
jgi:hypothetical protein